MPVLVVSVLHWSILVALKQSQTISANLCAHFNVLYYSSFFGCVHACGILSDLVISKSAPKVSLKYTV